MKLSQTHVWLETKCLNLIYMYIFYTFFYLNEMATINVRYKCEFYNKFYMYNAFESIRNLTNERTGFIRLMLHVHLLGNQRNINFTSKSTPGNLDC